MDCKNNWGKKKKQYGRTMSPFTPFVTSCIRDKGHSDACWRLCPFLTCVYTICTHTHPKNMTSYKMWIKLNLVLRSRWPQRGALALSEANQNCLYFLYYLFPLLFSKHSITLFCLLPNSHTRTPTRKIIWEHTQQRLLWQIFENSSERFVDSEIHTCILSRLFM